MRLFPVSQHMLVFLSVLSLIRAQTSPPTTSAPTTSETTSLLTSTQTTSATTTSETTSLLTSTQTTSATTTSETTSLLTPMADPCHNYTVLDDPWRSTDNRNTSQSMCDTGVSWGGWYRLFIHGQSAHMPDTCVVEYSCGTYGPMWLSGGHPTVEDEEATRNVCYSWGHVCCFRQSNPIKVKACPGGYYVYEFVRPIGCFLAYCAETTTESTTLPTTSVLPETTSNSTVIGLRMRLASLLDLTDSTNINIVLQQIKQELVKHGLSSSIKLKIRNVQKIKP